MKCALPVSIGKTIELVNLFYHANKHALLTAFVALIALACAGEEAHKPDVKNGVIFREAGPDRRPDFVFNAAVEHEKWMPESIGGGAALLDYNGDGLLDIYCLNGAYRSQKNVKPLMNRLFEQTDVGKFIDVTEQSGVGNDGYGMGVAAGDIDNDGDVDLYVANFGPDVLYENLGDGRFRDISTEAAIRVDGWSASVVMLDVNQDDQLDIYVTRYVDYDANFACPDAAGQPEYCGPKAFPGMADVLLLNEGGRFRDISQASGISSVRAAGLGVTILDVNRDGLTDIFVANDGDPNVLWQNQGDGTFRDIALQSGAALNDLGRAEAGMGVAIGDVDNDADEDLLLTHFRRESNTLYKQSEGGFTDHSNQAGLATSRLLAFTGFGAAFLDVDHDGDLDLAFANGRVLRGKDLTGGQGPSHWRPYAEPNVLMLNDGSGQFSEWSNPDEAFTSAVENTRGLLSGDIDNDGDLDLITISSDAPLRIYHNVHANRGNWLLIDLKDQANRPLVGSMVSVWAGSEVQHRWYNPGYGYLTGQDPRLHFGLGSTTTVDSIRVSWPSQTAETYPGGEVNQLRTLQRGKGRPINR